MAKPEQCVQTDSQAVIVERFVKIFNQIDGYPDAKTRDIMRSIQRDHFDSELEQLENPETFSLFSIRDESQSE